MKFSWIPEVKILHNLSLTPFTILFSRHCPSHSELKPTGLHEPASMGKERSEGIQLLRIIKEQ